MDFFGKSRLACFYTCGSSVTLRLGFLTESKSGDNKIAADFPAVPICARGGIGRHDGFRFHCASVQVQVLSGAPNLGTTYDTKTVIQIGWLFLYMARKLLKTLGFSVLRMPRQPLRSPVFHSGVWAAEIAEKTAAGLHPFGNGQGCMARPRRGRPRQNQPSAKRFYFFAEGVFSFIGWSKHRGPAYPYNSEDRAAWRSSRGAGISAVPSAAHR